MGVDNPYNFCAVFTQDSIRLVDSGIDSDEIHAGQFHRIAIGVYGPINVDHRALVAHQSVFIREIRIVVGIAIVKSFKHNVRIVSRALVHTIVRQTAPLERKFRPATEPLRPIWLCVERYSVYKSAVSLIVHPHNIVLVRSRANIRDLIIVD